MKWLLTVLLLLGSPVWAASDAVIEYLGKKKGQYCYLFPDGEVYRFDDKLKIERKDGKGFVVWCKKYKPAAEFIVLVLNAVANAIRAAD